MTVLLTLLGFLTLSPALNTPPVDNTWTVEGYTIQSSYDRTGDRILTIAKDGKEIYSKAFGQYWFVDVHPGKASTTSPTPVAADVTGDHIPDLVVESFPQHSQCCWSYSIISLGKTAK